jgi:predicted house-cleaning noncanonical NTP pyrophosphatase (MazG superfamily)
MRTEYNKLVRDKIPEIIRQSGNQCEVTIFSDTEYLEALRQKLIEEAQEAAIASSDELVKELADLYEVIDTILTATGIEREAVLAVQQQRREERGEFEGKIKLLWTLTD